MTSTHSETQRLKNNLGPVPCNFCGSEAIRELYPERDGIANFETSELYACTSLAYGHCGPIVHCLGCGLVRQNPQPGPADIATAYQDVVDPRYEEEQPGRVATFNRVLDDLEQHRSGGRLLDVGCHIGVFLQVAESRGWQTIGIEPSRWAAQRAEERGLDVRPGSLQSVQLAQESFDAVTMWDVVEHLPDPVQALRRTHGLLKPGGILAISTMNVEAWFPRLLGKRWPWYMQMHLYYFTPKTLSRMLEAAGFEIVEAMAHKRVVRLSYLVSRLEAYCRPVARALELTVNRLGQADRLVSVDLGDIFVTFARKRL